MGDSQEGGPESSDAPLTDCSGLRGLDVLYGPYPSALHPHRGQGTARPVHQNPIGAGAALS